MKYFRSFFAILLCLMLFLSACAQEDIDDLSDDSGNPYQPEKNGYWDLNDLVWGEIEFPVEGLYGVPHETLLQAERPVRPDQIGTVVDLPGYFLFELIRSGCPVPFVYDKSTGRFSYACADPLCTHGSCIWSGHPFYYHDGDELFLVRMELNGGYTIYSCGIHGENPRKLYESADRPADLIRDGDYLYFLENSELMRLRIFSRTSKKLLSNVWDMLPLGDCLLYVDAEDEKCYFYDIETGEKTLFEESCYLVAVHGGWIYYGVDGVLYRASQEDPSAREQVLTGYSRLCIAGDRLYYARSEVFSESEEFGAYFRYRICSAALDGSDEKPVWDLERYATDGIPVSVQQMYTDGKLLHIEYQTYRDFKNQYYPTFGEFPGERGDLYELFIDLSTGEELPFMGANSTKYKY